MTEEIIILSRWDKILYGIIVSLVIAALILFVKRYYALAVMLLSIVIDILDRVV